MWRRASWLAHAVSYTFIATKAMSKSRGSRAASCRCTAVGLASNGSWGPVTEIPRWRIASTCSAHGSMSVTSCPARDRNEPR